MEKIFSVRLKPEYKTLEHARKHYYIAPHFDVERVERDLKHSLEFLTISCAEYEIYDWTNDDQNKYISSLTEEEKCVQVLNNTLHKRYDERKVIGYKWHYCIEGIGPYDDSPKGIKVEFGTTTEEIVKEMIEKSTFVGILACSGDEWCGPAQITDPTRFENDERYDIVVSP